jgi:hypothetical protein
LSTEIKTEGNETQKKCGAGKVHLAGLQAHTATDKVAASEFYIEQAPGEGSLHPSGHLNLGVVRINTTLYYLEI